MPTIVGLAECAVLTGQVPEMMPTGDDGVPGPDVVMKDDLRLPERGRTGLVLRHPALVRAVPAQLTRRRAACSWV
jgi:hypothetical protein